MPVSDERWSCPHCHATVVVTGSQQDVRACIRAAQERHANAHRAAARLAARLPRRTGDPRP